MAVAGMMNNKGVKAAVNKANAEASTSAVLVNAKDMATDYAIKTGKLEIRK